MVVVRYRLVTGSYWYWHTEVLGGDIYALDRADTDAAGGLARDRGAVIHRARMDSRKLFPLLECNDHGTVPGQSTL